MNNRWSKLTIQGVSQERKTLFYIFWDKQEGQIVWDCFKNKKGFPSKNLIEFIGEISLFPFIFLNYKPKHVSNIPMKQKMIIFWVLEVLATQFLLAFWLSSTLFHPPTIVVPQSSPFGVGHPWERSNLIRRLGWKQFIIVNN
jgi:hypothetical protein